MEVRKASNRIKCIPWTSKEQILDLFRELVGGIQRKAVLKSKSAAEGCQVLKDSILQVQEWHVLEHAGGWSHCLKANLWLSWDTKAAYRRWKQGQATKEECRYIVHICRDGIRKVKAHLELRDKKKGTSQTAQKHFRCFSSTGINKEKMDLCWMDWAN